MKNSQNGFGLIGIVVVVVILITLTWGMYALSKSPLSPARQVEEGQSAIEQAQGAKDALEGADHERLQILQESP